jgi:hypothetical protein
VKYHALWIEITDEWIGILSDRRSEDVNVVVGLNNIEEEMHIWTLCDVEEKRVIVK